MNCNFRILLYAMLILFSGCKKEKISYPELPDSAKVDSFTVETKPLKIGEETFTADFGTIVVRENRTIPGSRSIHIPFQRIHSTSTTPKEPIFGLTGGPGISNFRWDYEYIKTYLPEHDFVLVGYRGIDGSVRLDCPEVSKAMKFDNDLTTGEIVENLGKAWNADFKSLKAKGVDLDGYTITECIEDIESVRKALGYKLMNLESGSYGTRIAYLYGLIHPESIYRTAMLGVNPPGHFVWESATIDAQLRDYAELWSKDTVMTKKSTDLYKTMQHVLENMPKKWLFFKINPDKVKVVTFCLLFNRSTAVQVFDSYVAAEQGDASGLALMSLAYDHIIPNMFVWGDLASKAVSADFDSTRDYYTEMLSDKQYPLGSPLSLLLWGPLKSGQWPVKPIEKEFRNLDSSYTETLLISGNIDFSTPPQFATNELLPFLKRGKQVILSECGHVNDITEVDPKNIKLILTTFFNTGNADTSLNMVHPVNFLVKSGFPKMAKFTVRVSILILLIFAGVIALIIRRIIRKRNKA